MTISVNGKFTDCIRIRKVESRYIFTHTGPALKLYSIYFENGEKATLDGFDGGYIASYAPAGSMATVERYQKTGIIKKITNVDYSL